MKKNTNRHCEGLTHVSARGNLNRFLCMILTLLMVLTALPMTAFAETADLAAAGVVTEGTSGDCVWQYDSGTKTLTISGSGATAEEANSFGGYATTDRVEHVIVKEGVTRLGNYALSVCEALTDITLPASLVSLGSRVFHSCENLTAVSLPGNSKLKEIGNYCFSGCENLTGFRIPKTVTSIKPGAFSGCKKITYLPLPDGLKELGNDALSYTGLVFSEIPYGITTLSSYLYYGCQDLESVVIPDSVKTIETFCFACCPKLNVVYLPGSVTTMNNTGIKIEEIYKGQRIYKKTSVTLYVDQNSAAEQYATQNSYENILYAPLYTMTYDANGGTGTTNSVKVVPGQSYAVRACWLTPPTGKKFGGWKNQYGHEYYLSNTNANYTLKNQNMDFTAIWLDAEPISSINCAIRAPKDGATPDLEAVAEPSGNYYAALGYWYLDEKPYPHLSASDTFTLGKRYAVRVSFQPKDGYYFEDDIAVKIGGQDAYKVGISTWETVFTAEKMTCSVAGVCDSYLDNYTTVIRLIKEGETTASYVTYDNSCKFGYDFEDVEPGVYTVRVSKRDHVTRDYTLNVIGDMTLDVEIFPLGDISGDGKVTAKDYAMANAHVQKVSTLSGYALKCGDVLKYDGKITAADAARINAHVQKADPLW